ncbi:multidrug effflux MFS transporter [Thioclava kandeliae]|uniref:Bcr/CflA family efflux transporter n=1 Tax=Thioclava kandeliae TaxID=3070818 RepID=A0ABV1SJJ7_9RHOB
MSDRHPPYWVFVTVLALLTIFPPLATDMYLSAMHELEGVLNASAAGVEMSLSLFFLGLCAGQLMMGPLIEGYGRKVPLICGAALFTVSSLALLFTRDITVFNSLRFVQAVGACAGMVVGRAMVSDLFTGRQMAKTLTVLVMLMTVGPIAAPFLGSVLYTYLGWQAIFVAMIVIGCVAAILAQITLPETLPAAKRQPKAFRGAFRSYGTLIARPAFVVATLSAALIQGAMFAFITGSAGVFKTGFGLGNMQYGLIFGLVAAALMLSSQLNTKLLDRVSPEALIGRGLPVIVMLALGLVMLSGTTNLWVYVVPLWLVMGMVGLLTANMMAVAMGAARAMAGVGSALVGAIQFAIAFLCSSSVALIPVSDGLAMAVGIAAPATLSAVIWFAGRALGAFVGLEPDEQALVQEPL